MDYIPNKKWKVQEETLADSKSDAIEKHWDSRLIQNDSPLPSFSSSSKLSFHFSVTSSHTKESITNGSVG